MIDPNKQFGGIDKKGMATVRDIKLVIDDFVLYDRQGKTLGVYVMHDCLEHQHYPVGHMRRGISQGTDCYAESDMSKCVRCHEPIPEEMQGLYFLYVSGLGKEIA
jgi:hypothetical protein